MIIIDIYIYLFKLKLKINYRISTKSKYNNKYMPYI